jgi:DNA-binding HxlR family transcriptional regulator
MYHDTDQRKLDLQRKPGDRDAGMPGNICDAKDRRTLETDHPLYHLLAGSKRYSEIKKAMPHITEKMLIQHLKAAGRRQTADPGGQAGGTTLCDLYTLTDAGRELEPVINAMAAWAFRDMKRNAALEVTC